MFRNTPLFRAAVVALTLATSAPALAFDLPLLTFPDAPTATTSTSNGK